MAEGGHSERPLLSFRLGAIRTPRSMSIDHVQTATPLSPPLSPQPTPASWRKQSPQAMIASLAAAAGSDASSSLASLSSALNVTLPPSAASAPSSTTTSTPLSSSTSSSALPLPPLPTHPSSAPSSLLDVMQRASGESKHLMARIYIEESSSCTGMFVHPELTVAEVVTELLRKECRKHFGTPTCLQPRTHTTTPHGACVVRICTYVHMHTRGEYPASYRCTTPTPRRTDSWRDSHVG